MDLRMDIFQVISETFELPLQDIREELMPIDIHKWDSLGQLNLVNAIERKFNIFFETEDIFKIISIKSIVDLVNEKVLNEA